MNPAHEQSDADVASLFRIAIVLFLSTAAIFLVIWILMRVLVTRDLANQPTPAPQTAGAFPEPRLEVQPSGQLEKLRADEEQQLNSYGWIDRNAGIARIPIDRAIQLILARGLPDVGGQQTPLQLMQARPQQLPSHAPPR
jgi:hypothetical protein